MSDPKPPVAEDLYLIALVHALSVLPFVQAMRPTDRLILNGGDGPLSIRIRHADGTEDMLPPEQRQLAVACQCSICQQS